MLKEGVDIMGIKPQMVLAFAIVQPIFHRHGYTCVITSATDYAPGRVEGSFHPLGLAMDFRTRHIMRNSLLKIVSEIKEALGEQFDVVLESNHLHIEWDRKEKTINPEDR